MGLVRFGLHHLLACSAVALTAQHWLDVATIVGTGSGCSTGMVCSKEVVR